MSTGQRGGPGIKDRNISESAGIRPYKLDLVYATTALFLAAKSANGEGSGSAEEGDWFYNSTNNAVSYYDGSAWRENVSQNVSDTGGSADLLVHDGTEYVPVALSGDATISAAGALTIAATSVEASMLGANLGKGYIPLDITSLREIATNATQALAAHGGILASDSDPSLARVNGATDKALRVIWDTAADTDEVQFPPVGLPSDFDASTDATVHLLCAMAGATDTPTIDVQVYDAVGDTEMGSATAAVTGTSVAEYSITLANANLSGHPTGFLNISLVPGAHTNDALHLYAAWIEYTRQS